jgi:hypothetical protein
VTILLDMRGQKIIFKPYGTAGPVQRRWMRLPLRKVYLAAKASGKPLTVTDAKSDPRVDEHVMHQILPACFDWRDCMVVPLCRSLETDTMGFVQLFNRRVRLVLAIHLSMKENEDAMGMNILEFYAVIPCCLLTMCGYPSYHFLQPIYTRITWARPPSQYTLGVPLF